MTKKVKEVKESVRSIEIKHNSKGYYLQCYVYPGSRKYNIAVNYPDFGWKVNFKTKAEAREYALKAIKKIEAQYKHVRIITRFLFD